MAIKGNDIALRAVEPSDLDVLYLWENNIENWLISSTVKPFSRYTLQEYVASTQDLYAHKQLRLMIDVLEDGNTIGCVDIFDFEPLHERAGVGILIGNINYRRKGLAKESIQLLMHYAKNILHLKQLYCNILESNSESMALFEQAGFEKIGLKKAWIKTPYGFENEWMYQIMLK